MAKKAKQRQRGDRGSLRLSPILLLNTPAGSSEIDMNIQIFGKLKCQDTKKAQRYFKERRIPFQFVDLTRKGLSKGELNSLKAVVGIDNLIDREGKIYAEKNLKYLIHDIEEEILKAPLLLRTPIVRNGRDATAGYQPDSWKAWK